ncbi:hypothetical protein ATO6_08265 [Oceanicola sp. 22II-s10i]|nr:hypothetical protein ATO6_08265 [Oceanicola sp. 22II-s10i]
MSAHVQRLEKLLAAKYGIRDVGLEQGLRKAGRRIPRRLRRSGRAVVEAQRVAGHPRLVHQIDTARVSAEAERLAAHLEAIDTADRRKGMILSVLGSVAFNLLLMGGLFLGFALWQGWL